MKHLTILLTMAITLTGLAQQMPYNPDANGDDFVGVDDVLGVLGVYDTALMQPDLQCDYEGTELEQALVGFLEGTLVMDSVYVEYTLIDSFETFTLGCPDPVMVETVLQRSHMLPLHYLHNTPGNNQWSLECKLNHLCYIREFRFVFSFDAGTYNLHLRDYEVDELTSYANASFWHYDTEGPWLPFPLADEWNIDENGLNVGWEPWSWAANCETLRVIPFWHEAE